MITNSIFENYARARILTLLFFIYVFRFLIFRTMNELKNDLLSASAENTENIQNKLYSWFEERGHVNKMRAYFREQLIAALKDGSVWTTANKANITSPKTQAVNLLVADFLMNQEHLYTLSVFITEVPLLGNLYRFSSYVNSLGTGAQTAPTVRHNYHLDEVCDILETLGLQSDTDIVQLTCQHYFNPDKDNPLLHSLLSCLFKAITTIKSNLGKYDKIQNSENISKKCIRSEGDTLEHRLHNWLVSVEDILSSFNLNEEQKNILKKLLKKYHQNNSAQETTYYKECLKKLEQLNKEMAEKVADIEQMVFQKDQIQNVTKQLRLEQKQLYSLINICEEKEKSANKLEDECNKRLQDIENQKHELRKKEIEMLKLKESLEHIDKQVTVTEPNQVKLLQEQNITLAKQLQEIKWILDELKEFKTIEQINSNKINNDNIERIEISLDKEMVKKLQRENEELREFIKIQRQRIEELSNRASNLTNQMEKTHHILPITTTDYYHTKNGKKKLNFLDNSGINYYTNKNISSTTATDYSTTLLESDNQTEDDMIKKARSRLKVLERNTQEVEQNLNFQKKNFLTNRTRHNKLIQINSRKSYNEIRSHLSDDSDISPLKSTSNRINLKELANKIGYHRSVRKSINNSGSENDTSPKTVRNHINITNNSSIKISSSDVSNNTYRNLPVNKLSSRIESLTNKVNCDAEFSTIKSDMKFTQMPDESQSQIETTFVDNKLLPNSPEPSNTKNLKQTTIMDTNEMEHHTSQPMISDSNERLEENTSDIVHDLQRIPTTVIQQDSFNEVDTSSTSKKEQESAISFGSSNKTDKSSDFWA